jgi:hypothetical protein
MSNLTAPENAVPHHPERHSPVPLSEAQVSGMIDEWVAHGIITPEQAARMRESGGHEAPAGGPLVHPSRSSLAVEALGYLGGVIVAVATMLIAARYWGDVPNTVRLLVVGVAAAALLAGGFALPDRLGEVGVRLRAVLWLASTAAASGFLAVLGNDVLTMADADAVLLIAVGTTVFAAWLWSLHRVIAQQIAMMVGSMMVAAAAIADFVMSDALPGVGVWGVGVVWLLLGWGGLLRPRRVAVALGAAGAVVGAMITMSYDAGIVFAMMTAAAIVGAAMLFHDLVLLAVGAVEAVQILPAALTRWFPDSLAAPVALLGLGGMLLGAALWIARRRVRHPETARTSHDYSVGQPAAALRAGAAVVVVVVGFVLAVALA